MDRISAKHNPRLDDELKHEVDGLVKGAPTEPRVEEFREQEGPADGEPNPSVIPESDRYLGLGPDAPAARREVSRFLGLHAFPGDRDQLVERARDAQATDAVLAALQQLPAGRPFDTMYDIAEALGLIGDDPGDERVPLGRKPPADADDPVA
jgi:hypothetical protein